MAAVNSIRLEVVSGWLPTSSFSRSPLRRTHAQAPGPGFPTQLPSVVIVTSTIVSQPPFVKWIAVATRYRRSLAHQKRANARWPHIQVYLVDVALPGPEGDPRIAS